MTPLELGDSYSQGGADVARVAGDRESFVLRPAIWAGGASDVGLRHTPNQDAIAMAAGLGADGRPVAVTCVSDGVSTSAQSESASVLAAETACSFLADRLRESRAHIDFAKALTQAFETANERIVEAAGTSTPGTWACTLVVAVVWHGTLFVGSVGDSRAYWVPDDGQPLVLSTDDSMAQAKIELGVDRDIAESSSGAHAITKWLGPGAHTVQPSLTVIEITQPGWLLTCSDGLWNYASHPEAMADAVNAAIARASASKPDQLPAAWTVCCELVDWANEMGGDDNVTVTMFRLPPNGEMNLLGL